MGSFGSFLYIKDFPRRIIIFGCPPLCISLREGVNHPLTLDKGDLLMDVELIDDGVFCALRDMKTDTKEYAVMRANVTQEERDFTTDHGGISQAIGTPTKGGGALVRRLGGDI